MKLRAPAMLTLFLSAVAHGAEPVPEHPLGDVLNMEVGVASIKQRRVSEAPAIVSVVSREEIERSGVRDLVDLLRTIPGFDFGVDIWNSLTVTFRGFTGPNGRILIAVDGLVMPDLLYGDFDVSNRLPINLIERVEIIRGPGSAMYGNFAELTVINVVSKIGAESNKSQATYTSGYYSGSSARQNLELQYAKPGDNSYLGISLFGGLFNRSDRTYVDPNGDSWNMQNDSTLRTANLNLNLRYGDLSGKFMLDNSCVGYRDGYGPIEPKQRQAEYRTILGDLSYVYTPISRLSITPQFEFKLSEPYRSTDVPLNDPSYYDATSQHFGYGLKAAYDLNDWVSLLVGGKYEKEHASYGGNEAERNYHFPGNRSSLEIERYSLFGETVIGTPYVDITAGVRFEDTRSYNSSLVPRIGLTKTFGDTSLKLIYNRAYRAPTIEQLSGGFKSGQALDTETADVYEIELGHRLDESNVITANYYEMRMKRVITYRYDSDRQIDTYVNSGNQGSRGVDVEFRHNDGATHATLRYSYIQASNPEHSIWSVPGQSTSFLGIPTHKVSLAAGYRFSNNLSISTTGIFTSERHAYAGLDPVSGASVVRRYGPEFYQDIYLLYKNAIWKGFDVGVGIYDLFNSRHRYLPTYDSGHAPLPAGSREYLFKLSYAL